MRNTILFLAIILFVGCKKDSHYARILNDKVYYFRTPDIKTKKENEKLMVFFNDTLYILKYIGNSSPGDQGYFTKYDFSANDLDRLLRIGDIELQRKGPYEIKLKRIVFQTDSGLTYFNILEKFKNDAFLLQTTSLDEFIIYPSLKYY